MLKLFTSSGDPHAFGKTLGEFGAQAAHDHLVNCESWASIMQWRGSQEARAMKELVRARFPEIHEEILGLAAGLELDADDVFLWNCRGDLWSLAPDGCTTVLMPSANGPRISHNEDGDPGFHGHCGIVLAAPGNAPRFASFVYPASIPGHTFAVTEAGLAMTVNNLRMRKTAPGVPRMVLTRAILGAPGLAEAVSVLRESPRAGGFHLSLAQSGRTELLSVEFSATEVSVISVQQAALHANHAIHAGMAALPQVITDSSLHRQQRGDEMLAAGPDISPLEILADRKDAALPIFRADPRDPDGENTMASADMHVDEDHVRWQVYDAPGQAPLYSLVDARQV